MGCCLAGGSRTEELSPAITPQQQQQQPGPSPYSGRVPPPLYKPAYDVSATHSSASQPVAHYDYETGECALMPAPAALGLFVVTAVPENGPPDDDIPVATYSPK
eukprot:TRINITY_DN2739_c0_g1_i1.p1 TRINITY_DN2739_c0_g1~~TRINITY_DN2739_c0_g1_i1.p1  ORF type:complete len:104 (+),score=17.41 TRINITY_DN2739_c0_g1_i1:20-331(+)